MVRNLVEFNYNYTVGNLQNTTKVFMTSIISYTGQIHRTQNNVVEMPAFIQPGQKPIKCWAEGGLVHSIDPNQPNKKPSYSQPIDALNRAAYLCKVVLRNMRNTSELEYNVTRAAVADFFNNFNAKVVQVALEQDARYGGFIEKTNAEYRRNRAIALNEAKIEAAKQAEKAKKSKIFVSPKALNS
jgi:hypothetical protein